MNRTIPLRFSGSVHYRRGYQISTDEACREALGRGAKRAARLGTRIAAAGIKRTPGFLEARPSEKSTDSGHKLAPHHQPEPLNSLNNGEV